MPTTRGLTSLIISSIERIAALCGVAPTLKRKAHVDRMGGADLADKRRASAAEIRVPSRSSGGLLATMSDAEPDRRPQRTEQISRALRLFVLPFVAIALLALEGRR